MATRLLSPNNWSGAPKLHEAGLSPRELTKIAAYVEDHIEQPITLAKLAAVAKLSLSHFARVFKHSTGITAMSFVQQCRIRRAQMLILERDLPLVEIALMTGFSDQSHFTRRFRLHAGCTPAAFARENGCRRAAQRLSETCQPSNHRC